jgi:hypothetical protein
LSTWDCGIWWFSAAACPWDLSWATILISRRLILSGNTQHWVTSILTLACVNICRQFSNKSGHDIITLVLGFNLYRAYTPPCTIHPLSRLHILSGACLMCGIQEWTFMNC